MVERNMRKTMIGVVTSDKMDKTIVVSVVDNVKHPLYGKIVKKTYKPVSYTHLCMSCTGIPSVRQTMSCTPASAASMMASAAKGGGTKIMEALQDVYKRQVGKHQKADALVRISLPPCLWKKHSGTGSVAF